MNKKRFLRFISSLLTVSLMFVMTACSSDPSPASPSAADTAPSGDGQTAQPPATSDAPVELNLFVDTSILPEKLAQHLPAFEQQWNCKVNMIVNEESQLWTKTDLELAAPSTDMNVIMGHWWHIPAQSAAGYLEPLDDLLAKVETYSNDDYADSLRKAVTGKDGKLYGVSMYHNGNVLTYRADLFAKLGLDVPTSFDDLEACAKAIYEQEGIPGIAFRGNDILGVFTVLMGGLGAPIVDENLVSHLDSPEANKALSYYANILQKYGPPGVANYTYHEIQNDFNQGKLGMFIDSYHASLRCQDPAENPEYHDKMGYALVPSFNGKDRETLPNSWAWIIPSKSDEAKKELSAQLVGFLMTPEVARATNLAAPLQILPDIFSYPAYAGYDQSQSAMDVMLETFKYGSADWLPRNEHAGEYVSIINNMGQAALSGTKTIEQALADAHAEMTALYQ